MFEQNQPRRRSIWPVVIAGVVLGGMGVWLGTGGTRQIDLLLAGVNPFVSPWAAERVEQPYTNSPLAVALEVESELRDDVDADHAMDFADRIATDLGYWMLARTGTSTVDEAERTLWEQDALDTLVIKWAQLMQAANAKTRKSTSLTSPEAAAGTYLHPDEAVLVFSHVAWRLDLSSVIIRSPIHHYVHLEEPGGDGIVGVEPTCFWRVDALGEPTGSSETCQGPKLTFGPRYHPTGQGHIVNPRPLPAGSYEPVTDAELRDDIGARIVSRLGAGSGSLADADLDNPMVVRSLWGQALRRGLDAAAADDHAVLEEVSEALVTLREANPDALEAAPDERLIEAAAVFSKGQRADGLLLEVFEHYEADGPVKAPVNEVHARAMWLDLSHRRPRKSDWNRRIVPLLNWAKQHPDAFAQVCDWGERALDSRGVLEDRIPECKGAR